MRDPSATQPPPPPPASPGGPDPPLDATDFALLDYLTLKAIESCIPTSRPVTSLSMLDALPPPKDRRRSRTRSSAASRSSSAQAATAPESPRSQTMESRDDKRKDPLSRP